MGLRFGLGLGGLDCVFRGSGWVGLCLGGLTIFLRLAQASVHLPCWYEFFGLTHDAPSVLYEGSKNFVPPTCSFVSPRMHTRLVVSPFVMLLISLLRLGRYAPLEFLKGGLN